eukprot:2704217-Ditylum_brightwellii.AAC.2
MVDTHTLLMGLEGIKHFMTSQNNNGIAYTTIDENKDDYEEAAVMATNNKKDKLLRSKKGNQEGWHHLTFSYKEDISTDMMGDWGNDEGSSCYGMMFSQTGAAQPKDYKSALLNSKHPDNK